MADKIKLGLAVLLVIAGVAGFYVLKDIEPLSRATLIGVFSN